MQKSPIVYHICKRAPKYLEKSLKYIWKRALNTYLRLFSVKEAYNICKRAPKYLGKKLYVRIYFHKSRIITAKKPRRSPKKALSLFGSAFPLLNICKRAPKYLGKNLYVRMYFYKKTVR